MFSRGGGGVAAACIHIYILYRRLGTICDSCRKMGKTSLREYFHSDVVLVFSFVYAPVSPAWPNKMDGSGHQHCE